MFQKLTAFCWTCVSSEHRSFIVHLSILHFIDGLSIQYIVIHLQSDSVYDAFVRARGIALKT